MKYGPLCAVWFEGVSEILVEVHKLLHFSGVDGVGGVGGVGGMIGGFAVGIILAVIIYFAFIRDTTKIKPESCPAAKVEVSLIGVQRSMASQGWF